MSETILPPHSTDLERAIEEVVAGRLAAIPMDFAKLWDVERAPPEFLADLAYTLSVDAWVSEWSETRKRAAIASSVSIHRHKGTVGSIKRALDAAGYGDATIVEQVAVSRYDGTLLHDGAETYRVVGHWAEYQVILSNPISIEQGKHLRRLLNEVAPARCTLASLDFGQAANLYDNTIRYDGTYTHGVV